MSDGTEPHELDNMFDEPQEKKPLGTEILRDLPEDKPKEENKAKLVIEKLIQADKSLQKRNLKSAQQWIREAIKMLEEM